MALREDTHPMVSDPKQRPLGFQGYILQHNKCALSKTNKGHRFYWSVDFWWIPWGVNIPEMVNVIHDLFRLGHFFKFANCNKFYQRLFRGNHVESCLIFVQAQISRKTRLH